MALIGALLAENGFKEQFVSLQRKAELLEKTQMGKELDGKESLALAGFFEVFQGGAGSYVCRQGDADQFMCLICQGRVDVVKADREHHQKVIATLGPGTTLGEMSLIDGEPRSAAAVAHTTVLLMVMTPDKFSQLADEYPRLWGKIVMRVAMVLSRRLRLTSGVLAEYLEH